MDLRTKRTLRSLREAFYELRRELPLERVTVRALCERAEVGKATFYLHYHSVYDLSDRLQEQVVEDIVGGLDHPTRVLDDTTAFTGELYAPDRERRFFPRIASGCEAGCTAPQRPSFRRRWE